MMKMLVICQMQCLTFILLPGFCLAVTITPELQEAVGTGEGVGVIIRFHGQIDTSVLPGRGQGRGVQLASLINTLKDQANTSQAEALEILQRGGAGEIVQLWTINGLAATVDSELIEELSTLSQIESVELDTIIEAPTVQLASVGTPEWNLTAIGASEMWDAGYDGTGTVVASMDSGVDVSHPDLAGSWRGGSNSWYDPNGEYATPHDNTGHGTQVTSLMVGGDAGGTSIGVAPGAQWIAVKIFNSAGVGTVSKIHQGFQWLLDPDGNPMTDDAPDVVNNSWSLGNISSCDTDFNTDIELLRAAGIAVVFAAGNQRAVGGVSPPNNPISFAVGAVDQSLTISYYSNRGPSACDDTIFPEIVAPGVSIRAADLNDGSGGSYINVTGTSFAAPHVAGTLSLLRQAHPQASVDELEQALMQTAYDLGVSGEDNIYGFGLINAVLAMQAITNVAPVANDDMVSILIDRQKNLIPRVTYNIINNDVDTDGTINPSSVHIINGPKTQHGGSVVNHSNGYVSYIPRRGYQGIDSFQYTVGDNHRDISNVATARIRVIRSRR